MSALATDIRYAADHGAKVISMSVGSAIEVRQYPARGGRPCCEARWRGLIGGLFKLAPTSQEGERKRHKSTNRLIFEVARQALIESQRRQPELGDYEIWVRDISKLDELGRHQMTGMANDLLNSRKRIDALDLTPAIFGENPIRVRMETTYEKVRDEFGKQLNAAYVGLRDSGNAVSKAAKNYRAIENKLSS